MAVGRPWAHVRHSVASPSRRSSDSISGTASTSPARTAVLHDSTSASRSAQLACCSTTSPCELAATAVTASPAATRCGWRSDQHARARRGPAAGGARTARGRSPGGASSSDASVGQRNGRRGHVEHQRLEQQLLLGAPGQRGAEVFEQDALVRRVLVDQVHARPRLRRSRRSCRPGRARAARAAPRRRRAGHRRSSKESVGTATDRSPAPTRTAR